MSSVKERVVDFVSTRIVRPSAVLGPDGRPVVEPARYNFSGPHSAELERISRAAAAASGIVPTPEELTAGVLAELQAQAGPQAEK